MPVLVFWISREKGHRVCVPRTVGVSLSRFPRPRTGLHGGTMDGFLPVVTRTRCYHTLVAVWDEPWFGEPEGS